jgi:hypothetical protein
VYFAFPSDALMMLNGLLLKPTAATLLALTLAFVNN